MKTCGRIILSSGLLLWTFAAAAQAPRHCFQTPNNGPNLGVWRITNDPAVRDHANYHNTQCWSPDGRYLCYTHWGNDRGVGSKSVAQVHVVDLQEDTDRRLDSGINPRWANARNWLFYVRFHLDQGPSWEKGTELMRVDLDSGTLEHVAYGVEAIGETDYEDRWLYGARRYRGQTPEMRLVRVDLRKPDHVEPLPEATGSQYMPNPAHPVFFTRHDHKSEPFAATRYWYDLEGRQKQIFVPTVQQCHMSWLGNGEYLLLGNGLVRGRRWDEPFPSNVHFLAGVTVGDISPCGRSGRYVTGDSTVADLRSGDGAHFIHPLSIICYPTSVADDSGIYDADPKGSPDGTKVCFVSNYDLENGPLTSIGEDTPAKADVLPVASTAAFPAAGAVVVQREVIGYRRKTDDAFEGLTRGLYGTMRVNLRAGRPVTSFDARLLTDKQWQSIPGPAPAMKKSTGGDSTLVRQRQTDVYVVVIRPPDRPWLRAAGGRVQLIPGEEHFETLGYHLIRDGRRITEKPIRAGAAGEALVLETLEAPGKYQAVAVERSGLESEPGNTIRIDRTARLEVLADRPDDFAWTADRWLVAGREVTADQAKAAADACREVVHRYDGVIRRQWLVHGRPIRQHDLNAAGQATRRLEYQDGKLSAREYHSGDGQRVSREIFSPDGYIVESIRYRDVGGAEREYDHWWFDRGTPVRRADAHGQEFAKQGDDWVAVKK